MATAEQQPGSPGPPSTRSAPRGRVNRGVRPHLERLDAQPLASQELRSRSQPCRRLLDSMRPPARIQKAAYGNAGNFRSSKLFLFGFGLGVLDGFFKGKEGFSSIILSTRIRSDGFESSCDPFD